MNQENAHHRKFYGRVKGKRLRAKQQERMDNLLPKIAITLPQNPPLRADELFDNPAPIWLEIGFGGGEHLAEMAAQNPDIHFIGSEAYINGVASILRHIEERDLQNIRLYPADARDLMEAMEEGALSRIYLLYPDPWPKKRHAERRFMHPDNLRIMARLLAVGSELRVASDIPEYIEHALDAAAGNTDFERVDHDIHSPWEGWHRTRYEAKAIREGRNPHYLRFVRR